MAYLSSGKDWDDVIPEDERKKVEVEEMIQQIIELNLPPRHRKKVTGILAIMLFEACKQS